MAERHATVHAARTLRRDFLGRENPEKLVVVVHARFGRLIPVELTAVIDEPSYVTHA
jgi:hypothetical protein